MNSLRVILVDGRPVRRRRLEGALSQSARVQLFAAFDAMASAYAAIVAVRPDAVLLGGELASQNGFERFRAFLAEQEIPLVPVWFFPFQQAELQTARMTEAERSRLSDVPEGDTEFLIDTIETTVRRHASLPVLPGRDPHGRLRAGSSRLTAPALTASGRAGSAARVAPRALVVIGSSTGGIEALHTVLAGFAEDCPPTLIVQHIRETFAAAFVERVNRMVPPQVVQAADGMRLAAGHVYVAPGLAQHLEVARAPALCCRLREGAPVSGHRPSIDALFRSVAPLAGPRMRVIGVLLTGMGADGARGLLEIREAGGHTIAQDEQSSVVYGMPRAAAELGAAMEVLPLARIARAITRELAAR